MKSPTILFCFAYKDAPNQGIKPLSVIIGGLQLLFLPVIKNGWTIVTSVFCNLIWKEVETPESEFGDELSRKRPQNDPIKKKKEIKTENTLC